MTTFESCQLYIIARYKANNFSKIRQDLSNLFFPLKVYEFRKISVPIVLVTLKIAFAASTL